MKIAVDEVESAIKSVETIEFKGSIDFSIDENGNVIDGEKVISHQELYELLKPVEEVPEDLDLPPVY